MEGGGVLLRSWVEPGDPGERAEGMERRVREPQLRSRLGEAGPAVVREGFSLERMVEETLAIYEEVLAA